MHNCNRKPLSAQAGKPLDIEAAMAHHEGLVHTFIRRQGGGALSYEEALQAGRIGLWRAIRGYDPGRGTAFSTYAWVAICRHIHKAVKEVNRELGEWSEVPSSWYAPDPDEWVLQGQILDGLSDLVGQLPARLRRVIVDRYGLGDNAPQTLKQVGKELGVCKERVRQLQQDGLAWLRHPVHSWRLRRLLGKNTAPEYRQALAQNAALRRSRRRRK